MIVTVRQRAPARFTRLLLVVLLAFFTLLAGGVPTRDHLRAAVGHRQLPVRRGRAFNLPADRWPREKRQGGLLSEAP
jgi:hypothetical protein